MTLPALPNQPFFIIGVHRSGTTLLRYMLSSHSRLYVPPESDFIPYFFLRHPTAELSKQRVADLLHTVFTRYRFVEEWQGEPPDPERFFSRMPERTAAAFLDELYRQYARQNGAERWGDKTPIYASYIDLIHGIYPEAQFIHIIRDARDAVLSMLDKYEREEFHVDIFFAARNWVRRIRKAQASGRRLGPNLYYELRYEDLVHKPEQELRAVCEFLGESFEPDMLQSHHLARERIAPDSHFFDNVRNPVSKQRMGRWQSKMSPEDQRLVQLLAGGLMAELGYELEELRSMTLQERARLVILAIKYGSLQTGRKVLEELGLFPPI
jgi:hypothetical protein